MALGLYGIGMGGTVLGGLTAPRIADRWGLTAPFVFAMILVGAMAVVFWLLARDAPVERPAATGGMFASLRSSATSPPPGRRPSTTSSPSAASSRCSPTCRSC